MATPEWAKERQMKKERRSSWLRAGDAMPDMETLERMARSNAPSVAASTASSFKRNNSSASGLWQDSIPHPDVLTSAACGRPVAVKFIEPTRVDGDGSDGEAAGSTAIVEEEQMEEDPGSSEARRALLASQSSRRGASWLQVNDAMPPINILNKIVAPPSPSCSARTSRPGTHGGALAHSNSGLSHASHSTAQQQQQSQLCRTPTHMDSPGPSTSTGPDSSSAATHNVLYGYQAAGSEPSWVEPFSPKSVSGSAVAEECVAPATAETEDGPGSLSPSWGGGHAARDPCAVQAQHAGAGPSPGHALGLGGGCTSSGGAPLLLGPGMRSHSAHVRCQQGKSLLDSLTSLLQPHQQEQQQHGAAAARGARSRVAAGPSGAAPADMGDHQCGDCGPASPSAQPPSQQQQQQQRRHQQLLNRPPSGRIMAPHCSSSSTPLTVPRCLSGLASLRANSSISPRLPSSARGHEQWGEEGGGGGGGRLEASELLADEVEPPHPFGADASWSLSPVSTRHPSHVIMSPPSRPTSASLKPHGGRSGRHAALAQLGM